MTIKEVFDKKNRKIIFDYIKDITTSIENIGKECTVKIAFNKKGEALLVKYIRLKSSEPIFTENINSLSKIRIENGKVITNEVGYCSFLQVGHGNSSHLYLNLIKVNQAEQIGMGYGSLMMRTVEEFAIANNLSEIRGIFLPLPPGSPLKSRLFYIRNGFNFRRVIEQPNDEDSRFKNVSCYTYTEIFKYKKDFKSIRTFEIDRFEVLEDIFSKESLCEQLNK